MAARLAPADRPGVAGLVDELRAEQAAANETVRRALAEVRESGLPERLQELAEAAPGVKARRGQGPGARRPVRRQRAADRDGAGRRAVHAGAQGAGRGQAEEAARPAHRRQAAALRAGDRAARARQGRHRRRAHREGTAAAARRHPRLRRDAAARQRARRRACARATSTTWPGAPGATRATSSRTWRRGGRAPIATAGWRRWRHTWPPAGGCCSPGSSANGSGWRRATSAARCWPRSARPSQKRQLPRTEQHDELAAVDGGQTALLHPYLRARHAVHGQREVRVVADQQDFLAAPLRQLARDRTGRPRGAGPPRARCPAPCTPARPCRGRVPWGW